MCIRATRLLLSSWGVDPLISGITFEDAQLLGPDLAQYCICLSKIFMTMNYDSAHLGTKLSIPTHPNRQHTIPTQQDSDKNPNEKYYCQNHLVPLEAIISNSDCLQSLCFMPSPIVFWYIQS